MVTSGLLRRVALVRTNVSEEPGASFISATRIGELGTTLAVIVFLRSVRQLLVTSSVVASSAILVTLMKEVLNSSETPFLTRATRRNIREYVILRPSTSLYVITAWCLIKHCQDLAFGIGCRFLRGFGVYLKRR
jgi:hypothetical protein